MVQESTMICVDSSEWTRNGDMAPTRLLAEQEAVRALMQFKLRSNQENAVGLIAMSDIVNVLSSASRDDRNLTIKLQSLKSSGSSKVVIRSMKTAYLALKHRQNRNSKQRIVVFIGSPLDDLEAEYGEGEFLKLAKKFKKEKVMVDFVLFGEAANNQKNKLIADFVETLNGKDGAGSHVIIVPAGDSRLFDVVLRSDICRGENGEVATGGGGGDNGFFGMDEEEDPELQMALRISLEEARQQPPHAEGNAPANVIPQVEQHQQMEVDRPSSAAGSLATPLQVDPNAMTEDEQMAYALRMSMMAPAETDGAGSSTGGDDGSGGPLLKPAPSRTSDTPGTPAPTPMEIDEANANQNNVNQLIHDPEVLQKLIQKLPTGDGETSEASKSEKDKDEESKDVKPKDKK
jgi:26S proteasome regulatory subunit N10